jgi:hypothetical protein
LDAYKGRLICWQRSAFDHPTFLRYLLAMQARYPGAERIYIALDNWPVHFPGRCARWAGEEQDYLAVSAHLCALAQSH